MPKHRRQFISKPPSTPPASFASSKPAAVGGNSVVNHASASSSSTATSSTPSVNELLSHLRSSQGYTHLSDPEAPRKPVVAVVPRSVPPPLQQILGAEPLPPPRPRIRLGASRRTGRIPGPPPPASWLVPQQAPDTSPEPSEERRHRDHDNSRTGAKLPGLEELSRDRTPLMCDLMVALARNWGFHVVYDQYYLYTLRPALKAQLLSYIAIYWSHGVGNDGLKVLFANEEDRECASAEEMTHLDLSRALGEHLGWAGLRELFSPPPSLSPEENNEDGQEEEETEESWDALASSTRRVMGVSRFSSLTHLSLAYPQQTPTTSAQPPVASWTKLERFLRFTPALTHLSLAGWPAPPEGLVRRLCRRILGLKWLDVSDCPTALYASLAEEAEWVGAWRGVQTVVARQVEDAPESRREKARVLVGMVRAARKDTGVGRWLGLVA